MKFPRAGLVFLIISITTSSFIFSGCSVFRPAGDFFSQRYVNIVSYYNTFYNAKHLYDEAVGELEVAENRHRQQRREGQFEVPQQVKQKFNEVIEKCSRLLHQHPTSKYAEDAVLMIGHSYYHMRQNVQAERKFYELLAEFPESRNIPDAQLLLAKTQRRMNKDSEARVALQDLVDRLESRRDRDIVARARMELGEIEVKDGNLNNAAEEFLLAIETARDRELRTEARFNLANVYFKLGQYDRAFDEYVEVIDDRPSSRILFESQRARARILTMSEEYEQAIELLEDLLTDLRLEEYISRIELEAAHIYREQGLYNKAIDQYVYVDTTHARTPVSTEAQYSLATIYKDTFGDFSKAKTYYEKVSRATPPSDKTRSAWAINDYLTRYENHKDEIARLDSVVTEQRYRIQKAKEEPPAVAEQVPEDTTAIADGDMPAHPDSIITDDRDRSDGVQSPEELQNQLATYVEDLIRNYSELAGLFYIEMERPDSAIYYYSRIVYDFPESSFAPLSLYALGELVRLADDRGYSVTTMEQLFGPQFASSELHEQREKIYQKLIERYPGSEYTTEAKRILGMEIPRGETDPMEEIYLQAEKELAEENHEDALYLFEYILGQNADSPYTVKACYAIGWLYENIFMKPDSAVVYYKTVLDYEPDSRFASAVQEKVNAWNAQLAEEEQRREEEQRLAEEAAVAEMADSAGVEPETAEEFEEKQEEYEEEERIQRGIPIARPTDRQDMEAEPDTTRKPEQNED